MTRAKTPRPKTPLSQRAYAKRRRVSVEAVSKAIAEGRLRESVVIVGGKPKIADPKLADREWKANTRPRVDTERAGAAAVAAPRDLTEYYASRSRREAADADRAASDAALAKIKLAERQGELVSAKDLEARIANVFAQCRTRLLSIPARVRQRDPSLSGRQLGILEALILEALEDLAGPPAADQTEAP